MLFKFTLTNTPSVGFEPATSTSVAEASEASIRSEVSFQVQTIILHRASSFNLKFYNPFPTCNPFPKPIENVVLSAK